MVLYVSKYKFFNREFKTSCDVYEGVDKNFKKLTCLYVLFDLSGLGLLCLQNTFFAELAPL